MLAAALAEAAPGPHLLTWLAAVEPRTVSRSARVDLLIAYERMAAWVAAGQARVLACLDHPADPADPAERMAAGGGDDWTREEVACALRLSAGAAQRRLDVARALDTRLPATRQALEEGRVSHAHAVVLAEATDRLTADGAAVVEARVLARAESQTPAELRRAARRAALAVDPLTAEEAHVRARTERAVQMFPLDDGMAELRALLPAEGALTVMTALTALANHPDLPLPAWNADGLDAGGFDPRGIDARRADALVALAAAALDDPALPRQHELRPHIQVTVSAGTLLGLSDEPGELAGYGPITAATARRIAANGTWRRLLTDPATGIVVDVGSRTYTPSAALTRLIIARDRTCTFPHCQMPAQRCDIDHGIAFAEGGPTDACNCHALCRRHHRAKHEGGWRVERRRDGSATWTSPTGKIYRTRPPSHAP